MIRRFQSVLPKRFPLFQLLMRFKLFKQNEASIINACMNIVAIMVVILFLWNFSISFCESYVLTFMNLNFYCSLFCLFQHNMPHTWCFKSDDTFSKSNFKGTLWILKDSPQASVVNVLLVLIDLQTKLVFFPLTK